MEDRIAQKRRGGEVEKERSSIHWLVSQMAKTGLNQPKARSPETPTFPTLWAETYVLGQSSAAFSGAVTGNWMRSMLAGTELIVCHGMLASACSDLPYGTAVIYPT